MMDRTILKRLNDTLDEMYGMMNELRFDLIDLVQTHDKTMEGEDNTQHVPAPLKESRSYTEDYMS